VKEYFGLETTWAVIALVIAGVVGWLDLVTGYEISFSIFYLVPVAIATWKSGRTAGLVISVVSAGTWLLVDLVLRSPEMFKWVAVRIPSLPQMADIGPAYSSPATPVWNALVRMGFFVIIALLLSGRRDEAQRRKRLPRER